MANVTDSASVLVVPSGWSDGVLGSLQPDDGSSDFTFSRGSDLSATKVNEQGYIEKGYENLLLQSNSFTTSPWILTNGPTLTSGISDPDGGTNAWQLNFDGTANARIEQQVNVSNNSVYTFSFYGRVSSGTKDINVGAIGQLNTKTLTTEWQRIELFGVTTGTITFPQIRTKDTSVYSIEIYQAQFNQGVVAYPYIETGITTAKNPVILEDQPRIDYTSGNGAVLIEPQRTNLSYSSEKFGASTGGYLNAIDRDTTYTINYGISPEGVKNSTRVQFSDTTAFSYRAVTLSAANTASLYVKGTSGEKIRFGFGNNVADGGVIHTFDGTWQRVVHTASTGVQLYLSSYTTDNQALDFEIYGLQHELSSYPTSYIPTYGTTQTRLKDTATLTKNATSAGTIYININAQTSRTLTFLGADISVTEGVNKIAMAYSPTALKVSKNGTIVANITRAFDTTALTQIQLGHRNNFEQTTDSINQFLTLDSFLNDTKLNELTA